MCKRCGTVHIIDYKISRCLRCEMLLDKEYAHEKKFVVVGDGFFKEKIKFERSE